MQGAGTDAVNPLERQVDTLRYSLDSRDSPGGFTCGTRTLGDVLTELAWNLSMCRYAARGVAVATYETLTRGEVRYRTIEVRRQRHRRNPFLGSQNVDLRLDSIRNGMPYAAFRPSCLRGVTSATSLLDTGNG